MGVNHENFSHENSYHINLWNEYFFLDYAVQARTSKPVLIQFQYISIITAQITVHDS